MDDHLDMDEDMDYHRFLDTLSTNPHAYMDEDLSSVDEELDNTPEPEGPVTTGEAEFRRYGHKKTLAPYVTVPLNLRGFLEESLACVGAVAGQPIMQRYRSNEPVEGVNSRGQSNGGVMSLASRQARRDMQIFRTLGLEEDSTENKAFRQKMTELRNRIKNTRVKPGAAGDLKRLRKSAPALKTLEFRADERRVMDLKPSNAISFVKSTYSAPYILDTMVRRATSMDSATLPVEDLVISVVVYRGRPPVRQTSNKNVKSMMRLYCLGSNTLAQLVNMIKCPADEVDVTDLPVTDTPEQQEEQQTLLTERVICIDKVIYTDAPHQQYSRASYYEEWNNNVAQLPGIRTAQLEQTLMDVEMRLGLPYVYKHGVSGCEHFIVFSDVRLLHADDEMDLSKYPRIIEAQIPRTAICYMCRNRSRWHMSGSKRFPLRRVYLCDRCNSLINFDDQGEQVEREAVITLIAVAKPLEPTPVHPTDDNAWVENPEGSFHGENSVHDDSSSLIEMPIE